MDPMNLSNPYMRFLFWVVATAAAIRLVFELIAPVAVWLLLALIGFAVLRLVAWYRGRW